MDKLSLIALALAKKGGGGGGGGPYDDEPAMNGRADPGESTAYARGDHVHPSDDNKQDAEGDANLLMVMRTASENFADIPANERITLGRLVTIIGGWYAVIAGAIPHTDEIPIAANAWTEESGTYTYEITLTGLRLNSLVIVEFSDTETEYTVTQAADTLTISTTVAPTANITVKVVWYR